MTLRHHRSHQMPPTVRIVGALARLGATASLIVAAGCGSSPATAPASTASNPSSQASWDSPSAGPSRSASVASSSASSAMPSASSSSPAARRGLAGLVIGVDAGHNGGNETAGHEIAQQVPAGFGTTKECDTTGTESASGYTEHAHNFDVAMRLAAELRAQGARVVMTRTTDTGIGPCVNQRNAIFRAAHVTLAVSIHADGNTEAGARGFHVIEPVRSEGGTGVVTASGRLAIAVRDAFAAATGMPRSTYIGGGTALSPRSDIAACNLALAPTVMIETGNMRDATDAALLASPAFRQREADGLAHGIEAYLGRG